MRMPADDPAASPFAFPVFRAVWLASTASHFGGLIQSVGAAWLMLSLTHSARSVALVQTAATLPIVLLSLLAGAVADNRDRRHVMIAAQLFMLLVAFALAILGWLELLTPALLLGSTFLLGCGAAFHAPAWQASVGDLVPRRVIPAAIIANGLGFNLSRTVGPAVGGLIVAAAGATAAFVVNAISFIGLVVVLSRWRPAAGERPARQRIGASMLGGVRHAIASPVLRVTMIRAALFGTMSSTILALMPLVAHNLVGGTAQIFGALLAAFGLGSILGSFVSRRFRQSLSNESAVRIASVAVACGAIGVAADLGFTVTALALLAAGAGTVLALSTFNVAVQMSAPRVVLARSLALYQMAIFAGIALGSGVFGSVAQARGVSVALASAAILQLLAMLLGCRWPLHDHDAG
ncbi:MFS transporter [Sphingomonas sp. OK281]|uniref:MFS transporter n=1 Tax=Sphingomonas sp. OK281 TaxID=1881067 RepID=UPI0008DEC538|nr:MFS transporter [Sphingomonas sp. OK281]SFN83802.1 Predicted arabinose efflux permease, MFS family [Sphingomonas sp. OK281]